MKLEKPEITTIHDIFEHYIDNGDLDDWNEQRLQDIVDMCKKCDSNIGLEIKHYRKIYLTNDVPLNIILNHMLQIGYDHPDWELLKNYVWKYLKREYAFDPEDHHLLKHTFEEAVNYAIVHIAEYCNKLVFSKE